MKIALTGQGFDMVTVPQSHENHMQQTNRHQVASLLPAKFDFLAAFNSELQVPSYFHIT
jgi:hypothetical protein